MASVRTSPFFISWTPVLFTGIVCFLGATPSNPAQWSRLPAKAWAVSSLLHFLFWVQLHEGVSSRDLKAGINTTGPAPLLHPSE